LAGLGVKRRMGVMENSKLTGRGVSQLAVLGGLINFTGSWSPEK
jgi:hypothetical protein